MADDNQTFALLLIAFGSFVLGYLLGTLEARTRTPEPDRPADPADWWKYEGERCDE